MHLYTIGELATRTGIGVSALRAWERRYGFPEPQRLPGGHRRYTARDADAVVAVARARSEGLTMEAAVASVRRAQAETWRSLHAAVRQAVPDLPPVALSARAMLAVTRAVEDEAAARAERPVLVGSFEEDRFWRRSEDRWVDLARTAEVAVVFAVLPSLRQRDSLWEVPVDPRSPMRREWSIVCDSPTFSACLVGVERPGARLGGQRVFDALWTAEPLVTREAARAAAAMVRDQVPALAEQLRAPLLPAPVAGPGAARGATALTNRILAYLDEARLARVPR